jgi:hypothetical protein
MGFGGWIDTGTTGDFELSGTQSVLPYFQNELGAEARRKDVRALGALLFLLLTGTRPDLNALRQRRSGESAIIDLRPAAPLALAEIAESALELRNLRPFGTAGQMRNALTTYLWGQRDAQGLPNAATITGSPARLEIAPAAPSIAVPTVEAAAVASRRIGRRASRFLGVGAVAAAVAALIAIAAVALFGRNGAPAVAEPAPLVHPVPVPAPAPTAAAPAADSAPAAASPRSAAQTTRFGPAPARPPVAPMPAQGVVELAVAPWGEVFVNGAARGTSPPLKQLMLPAGRYTIEVRNGSRAPFVAQVDVAPGRPQQLHHRFQ